MISIINKKKNKTSGGIYIGRPGLYGNPYSIGKDGNREEVIIKYKDYFDNEINLKGVFYENIIFLLELAKKDDLNLICWCNPLACHGDVIKEWIENQLKIDKTK